jgi:prephenate dehydrogenase
MAGRELTGFAAAKANLFQGATTILTPTPRTTDHARQVAHGFWSALGTHLIELDPASHDRLVAEISHLPHLVAAALTQAVSPESLALVGSGFRDTTRVAAGPAEMWQEILLTNRLAVGDSLDRLIEILRQTRQALSEQAAAPVKNLLTRANEVRQHIVKT